MATTPMMAQYLAAKREHPDAVLFFRMGDFYEMFGGDAERVAPKLGIALTSRDKGPEAVPMAGVPVRSVTGYLRKLLALGERVAICEQMQDPREAQGLVDRQVVRVITAGTLTEDDALPAKAPNYLAAVAPPGRAGEPVGVAWADLSTGEFRCADVPPERLADALAMVDAAEVLLPSGAAESAAAIVATLTAHARGTLTEQPPFTFGAEAAGRALREQYGVATLAGFGFPSESAPAARAAGAVLRYLADTQRTTLSHLRPPRYETGQDHLVMDRATRRALELTEGYREGTREGTLLAVLDQTVTSPGGRALRAWLLAPLTDVAAIRERQGTVAAFVADGRRRGAVRAALGRVQDLERLGARIATGRATPRDVEAVGRSLAMLPDLAAALDGLAAPALARLRTAAAPLPALATRLTSALSSPAPLVLADGGIFRDGHDAELDDLRATARAGGEAVARFQAAEIARTGIASLKVGYTGVFGYYLEVPRSQAEKVPADYKRRQSLKHAERFVTPELAEFERKVLTAEDRAKALERRLFEALRAEVAREVPALQARAGAVAELDALAALAEVADRQGWVAPTVDDSVILEIHEGRHPVLEHVLGRDGFVANDCVLGTDAAPRLVILTGPNMAGKSTFIRQVALVVLLAQMGSFVPAKAARVGVADRLFARVGSADELARGASTFMVEMTETAHILNAATARSVVVLDEIGRGTSTFDGVAIAWAVAEHLHDHVKARALFATHYHELTAMAETRPGVANWNVAVAEEGERVVFLHRIVPGTTDRSYGVHVAKLAGVPRAVVQRAEALLARLESGADGAGRAALAAGLKGPKRRAAQLPLFAPAAATPDPVREALKALDVDGLTPREALARLAELRDRARGKA